MKKAISSLFRQPAVFSIIALLLGTAGLSHAQDSVAVTEEGPRKVQVFLNGGMNFPYTDVSETDNNLQIGLGASYVALPSLHINVEVNKGWLKGGTPDVADKPGFKNSYVDFLFTARFHPLALVKNEKDGMALKVLSGIYIGTGAGLITYKATANAVPAQPSWGALSADNRVDFFLPLEAGISFPVAEFNNNQKFYVQLNYRSHLCSSDNLDGYAPKGKQNKKNDAFNTLSIGVGLDF